MYFLIGVFIFIIFLVIAYFYLKRRVNRIIGKLGFSGVNIKEIVEEARLHDQDVPKSLSSMDSIYLQQIEKDFPDLNVNELKRDVERIILDVYKGIEEKDSSEFEGKIKSFVDSKINDYGNKRISFDDIRIHNTVISSYKKDRGIATLYFGSSFQYYFRENGSSTKIQDRVKVEYIYVYDTKEVSPDKKVLGIRCPNCGSPITSLGEKSCSYCGGSVVEIVKKVFVCNDIKQY